MFYILKNVTNFYAMKYLKEKPLKKNCTGTSRFILKKF